MRSHPDITREIAALDALIPAVPPINKWGDDNHAAIRAQMMVLREQLDHEAIADRFLNLGVYVYNCACDAADWMRDSSPSADWAPAARGGVSA